MNRNGMDRFLTDAELLFIQQKTVAFLERVLKSRNGKYVHFSKDSCAHKHRAEIYKRVTDILRLSGVQFKEKRHEPPRYQRSYSIRIL